MKVNIYLQKNVGSLIVVSEHLLNRGIKMIPSLRSILLFLLFKWTFHSAFAASPFTLDQFLNEVRQKNYSYQGSLEMRDGAGGRTREADLVTSPSLFANLQHQDDSKLPVLPFFAYDSLTTNNLSLGISQQFGFGLNAKLYYAYDYTKYNGASLPGGGGLDPQLLNPQDARPVVELSMPLLGGGFGRTIRANRDLKQFQAQVDQSNAEGQLRDMLVQAESTYWQLAVNREIVMIREKAVQQALATYNYNFKKARMSLGENSDVLQSEAALENAKLSLKSALDNQRASERSFNLVRNRPDDSVPEVLLSPDWDDVEKFSVVKERKGNRADVEAAASQVRVSEANSQVAVESNKPTLELYGSYAVNGRSQSLNDALSNSFNSGRPTSMVGVRFNMPLNFGAQDAVRVGAEKQSIGADHRYRQTLANQEQEWADLINRLTDAQAQFHYARIIEGIQKKKIENEYIQLKHGRSTTFQVLQFEQDFTNSKLARAQLGIQVLNLRSQLKLYQPASNGPLSTQNTAAQKLSLGPSLGDDS